MVASTGSVASSIDREAITEASAPSSTTDARAGQQVGRKDLRRRERGTGEGPSKASIVRTPVLEIRDGERCRHSLGGKGSPDPLEIGLDRQPQLEPSSGRGDDPAASDQRQEKPRAAVGICLER